MLESFGDYIRAANRSEIGTTPLMQGHLKIDLRLDCLDFGCLGKHENQWPQSIFSSWNWKTLKENMCR